MVTNTKESNKLLHCSFCGKNQNEVNKLIAGPSVFICDECVDLCNEIIRDELEEKSLKSRENLPKPKEIKTILDETRGSKSDQIAKILVNTNVTATTQILNTSQTTNYVYPYELHSSYTPSVSDTGTIIIIVNFAIYISFNNNLTSKLKLLQVA